MAKYTVAHSYDSYRDGKRFGPWAAGDQVEIDDADVEWVRRDSPGVLGDEPAAADPVGLLEEPPGNASKAAWVAYAVAKGADEAEAEALTRDELRDAYETKATPLAPPAEGGSAVTGDGPKA